MKEGAFALVDCLGWKGIWQVASEAVLVEKIKGIHSEVEVVVDEINSRHRDMTAGAINAQIRLISDTVAVSIQHEKGSRPVDSLDKAYLVRTAALCVVRIQRLLLAHRPQVALRGCISYGEHLVVNNFILGPSVDEAADYYETPEGALVWLLPSAGVHINCADLLLHDIGSLFLEYRLPLKSGHNLKSLVINPLYLETSSDQRQALIGGYFEAMRRTDRLDVWLKGQNTMDFLQEAENLSVSLEKEIKSSATAGLPSQT